MHTSPTVAETDSAISQRFDLRAMAATVGRVPSWVVATLAVVAASLGMVAIESGGAIASPNGYAALIAWGTVTFVAAGLYWRRWRPGNPLAGVLVLIGFLVAALSLLGLADPLAFSVGVLVEHLPAVLIWYALLALPSGRLDRIGRTAMWVAIAYVLLAFLPWVLVTPVLSSASPAAVCHPSCPENALLVVHDTGVASAFHHVLLAGRVAAVAAVFTALVVRGLRARKPERWMLMPVTVVGLTWVGFQAFYGLARTFAGVHSDLAITAGAGLNLARASLAAAFLLAPLQARAFAGVALERMIKRFELAPTLAGLERATAQTLDDPRLRIAFWLPRSRRYVDVSGQDFRPPDESSRLVWTVVGQGSDRRAGLAHDPSLADNPELVEAVCRALLLAISTRRVEDEIERSVAGLRESRRRLLAADAAERRRLERELHRTAQQHLVALRVSVELARERADMDTALAERLAALGHDLDRVVQDVRSIAVGIYPPQLEEEGLRGAVLALARHMSPPPELNLQEVGRLPEEVENCVYFCIAEALSNVIQHAGRGTTASVQLARDDHGVRFRVDDDGVGFDTRVVRRVGLEGLTERMAAVDGVVSINSIPGRGTVVSGIVPVESELVVLGRKRTA